MRECELSRVTGTSSRKTSDESKYVMYRTRYPTRPDHTHHTARVRKTARAGPVHCMYHYVLRTVHPTKSRLDAAAGAGLYRQSHEEHRSVSLTCRNDWSPEWTSVVISSFDTRRLTLPCLRIARDRLGVAMHSTEPVSTMFAVARTRTHRSQERSIGSKRRRVTLWTNKFLFDKYRLFSRTEKDFIMESMGSSRMWASPSTPARKQTGNPFLSIMQGNLVQRPQTTR
mmetsp:Transcript_19869/g.55378  ORF Transcript_19869/g.55378 Transcript_19869/m.55378 type:complete len:227 (-) Transcript_19869:386-1066(-)